MSIWHCGVNSASFFASKPSMIGPITGEPGTGCLAGFLMAHFQSLERGARVPETASRAGRTA